MIAPFPGRKETFKDMSQFNKKILLITGGTGSFGNAVLRRFLATDIAEMLPRARIREAAGDGA